MKYSTVAWIPIISILPIFLGCSEDSAVAPRKDNHPPVIVSQSDTFAIVGDTLRLQFRGSDPDGDPLSFRQEILCTWGEIQEGKFPIAAIDAQNGSFWFWPKAYDMPERRAIVTVGDGSGGYDSTEFVISVSAGP